MSNKLIKLDDYEIAWKAKQKASQLNTGIECPDCQDELQYLDPNVVLMSHLPKKAIHCANCGFSTYITA
jgi:transcription elongation factor Elf1